MRSAFSLGVALLVAIAIAAACGPKLANTETRIVQKNQISVLHSEIREWRREAGLGLEPHPQEVAQILRGGNSVKQVKAVCPSGHAVNESCADVCLLADHICDNAESICNIAAELDGDKWAAEKCASGKASCRDAKKKCCTKCSQAKSL